MIVRFRSGFCGILIGLSLTGWETITPDLKNAVPPPLVVNKVPLKVAVVVPQSSRVIREVTFFDSPCWGVKSQNPAKYGEFFRRTVQEIFSRVYEQVEIVESTPVNAAYSAILEASISSIGFRAGCPATPAEYSKVDGALRALDAEGKEVWHSTFTSKRHDMSGSIKTHDQRVGEGVGSAMGLLVWDWVQELQQVATKQWARGGLGLLEIQVAQNKNPAARDEPAPAIAPSDVDQPIVSRKATKKDSYAIVVGIEQYREKLPKADFAVRDANAVRDYLTKTLGYPEENVVLRTNDRATKNDLEKYFGQWLKNHVEPGGSVFIYYSGHGAPNPKTGEAFLVPYDGDPAYVNDTAFPLKKLYDSLEQLPAKEIVVVLDSCFSGAGGRSVLAKGARPMGFSVENSMAVKGKTVVLAASSGEQISSTYEEKGHGLMTYFFLKGLQGEADVDADGSVTMVELFDYVKPKVERVARKDYNNDQTPQLLADPARLKHGGATLIEKAGK